MRLLFVCSGNICRSPMAAAYFRSRAESAGLSHVVVDSAGTLGIEGAPPSAEAVEAMRALGVDLSVHRSRGLTEADLRTADLVVAMDHGHLVEMARRFPRGCERRLLLRAFEHGSEPGRNPVDLADPMGRAVDYYREQLTVMVPSLDHLALHLKHDR